MTRDSQLDCTLVISIMSSITMSMVDQTPCQWRMTAISNILLSIMSCILLVMELLLLELRYVSQLMCEDAESTLIPIWIHYFQNQI